MSVGWFAFWCFFLGYSVNSLLAGEDYAGTGVTWPYAVVIPLYVLLAVGEWRVWGKR